MKNLEYEETTNKQKACCVLKDTLKVGVPYALIVILVGWAFGMF